MNRKYSDNAIVKKKYYVPILTLEEKEGRMNRIKDAIADLITSRKCQDIYKEPEIFVIGNAIVKAYTPILNQKERERRMELINDAAVDLVMSRREKKI